jgi:hypothetical protein
MNDKPELTAIDVLLTPDETMVKRAVELNKRMVAEFPEGFELDESHIPHVSVLQRYVRTKDLKKVYDAVERVITAENVASLRLNASKIEGLISSGTQGLAVIAISPTEDLLNFQLKLIDALEPYVENNGTAAAYLTSEEEPDISDDTLKFIENFVPDHSGKNFVPHVSVGVSAIEFLEKIASEPFTPLKFSPAGIAVYHLGNYGTAQKVLKEWSLSQEK